MSNLLVVGLNHKVAPVEVREQLAVSPGHLPATLVALRATPGVEEVAVLSTCNRLEVYAVVTTPGDGQTALLTALAEQRGLAVSDFDAYLCIQVGETAAHHLCRVAAGLDSLLVGEYQILGQTKEALQAALDAGTAGPVLSALFRQAIRAGKRARTETEIGLGGRSLGQVAASLARDVLGDLTERTALLLGAGKISELAGRALVEQGLRCLLVANRTYDRARQLAQELGGRATHFDALEAGLAEADLVIAATGAPHIVLHAETIRNIMSVRPDRPLVVVDLAVPRNVDAAARQLPGVHLYDMDDLSGVVATHHPVAAPAIAAAEAIVDQETAGFLAWWRERQAAPLIQALCAQAQAIRQAEIEKAQQRLGELTPQQQKAVDALATALTNKILHISIQTLKSPYPH